MSALTLAVNRLPQRELEPCCSTISSASAANAYFPLASLDSFRLKLDYFVGRNTP